jgi:hypothetical protein
MGKHAFDMPELITQTDETSIDQAMTLAACMGADDIRAWIRKRHGDLQASLTGTEPASAYAAGFGTLAVLTTELLGIIDRQRTIIEAGRA